MAKTLASRRTGLTRITSYLQIENIQGKGAIRGIWLSIEAALTLYLKVTIDDDIIIQGRRVAAGAEDVYINLAASAQPTPGDTTSLVTTSDGATLALSASESLCMAWEILRGANRHSE